MKRKFSKVSLMLIVCLHTFSFLHAQGTSISGSVTDADSESPLLGANIRVKGTVLGTITNVQGDFSLRVRSAPPITLVVSSVGYDTKEVEITDANTTDLNIALSENVILGQEVVISASRVEENTLRSPISIQRMDILDVQNNASTDFYDALKNLNGVDFSTQSLTFKSINTRGFGANGNTRFVQLIDGIDNQAPGLNFSVGNVVGINELDLESVELIPGPASALYGPNALQGILLMQSKSPFEYQGLSAYAKLGVNHVNGEDNDPSLYQDYGLRYAKAFNNRFAFKLVGSFLRANDFVGGDLRDQSGGVVERNVRRNTNRANNRLYDGVNVYGDFAIDLATIGAVTPALGPLRSLLPSAASGGAFTPTGYAESSFVDPTTESMKLAAGVNYRITDNLEILGQYNWGSGSTVYTANDRFVLDNFSIWTGKLEIKSSNFFIRGYTTQENSGDTYAANTLASLINQRFYLPAYTQGFLGARLLGATIEDAHAAARRAADAVRPLPGSPEFDKAVAEFRGKSISDGGALFIDRSNMYHFEGSYNFRNEIDMVDLVAGANYRIFNLNSDGTLFALEDNGDEVSYHEYGAYVQAKKSFVDDQLDIQASVRFDKNEFFDGQFSPRVSAVFEMLPNQFIRGAFQRGFRIPTTQDQFIDLDVVTRRLVGSVGFLKDRYNFLTNTTYLSNSVDAARRGGGVSALVSGTPLLQKKFDTEKINTLEGGYRGLFADGKLLIDAFYFYNIYQDFLAEVDVTQAHRSGSLTTPPEGFDANTDAGKAIILAGGNEDGTIQTQRYGVDINADGNVRSQGWGLGAEYTLNGGYRLAGNVSYNQLISQDDLLKQGFRAAFNTPEYRYNVSFGNRKLSENVGFNVAWRWQESFLWESSFGTGIIPEFGALDAQITFKIPDLKTSLKIGGSNILNERFVTSYANPTQGAVFFVQLNFDEFLN